MEQLHLFPSKPTAKEALEELKTHLPITTTNELVSAVNLYVNSLIRESSNESISTHYRNSSSSN